MYNKVYACEYIGHLCVLHYNAKEIHFLLSVCSVHAVASLSGGQQKQVVMGFSVLLQNIDHLCFWCLVCPKIHIMLCIFERAKVNG